jgi:DNA-binding transcriptional ArsR family regulator
MISTPKYIWDVGSAYDLFTSLTVLHDPNRYGLRGSWAAGVRSRIPTEHRDFLQEVAEHHYVWPIPWLASLTGPKDSATVLEQLDEIPTADLLRVLSQSYMADEVKALLYQVAEKCSWDDADKQTLHDVYVEMYRKEGQKKKRITDEELENTLNVWADPEGFGKSWLAAVKAYYEVFFREEEMRILPALQQSAAYAQEAAQTISFWALLTDLSQGLKFDYDEKKVGNMREVVMIPSFWTTPLSLFMAADHNHERWLFMFGGRPDGMSLVPGEAVPELLYQTLKALADPTRLRILRYLAEEPLTPAELARRLRLRPPTVIHHLDTLRLARLVQVTLSPQGRRYEARREQVDGMMCGMLGAFLDGETLE